MGNIKMNDSKVNRNHLYKEIIYSILVIFLIIFSVNSYPTVISNILCIRLIITTGIVYLLRKVYQIIKYILNNNYLILIVLTIFIIDLYLINFIDFLIKSLSIFIKKLSLNYIKKLLLLCITLSVKFIVIILSLVCLFLYILDYNYLENNIINVILFFMCIICIIFYRKQILILIITGLIVFIVSFLLGLLQSTNFSVAVIIFLFGLLFAIVENIEKFIKLDIYYPKEIITLENEEKIKRNKLVLNFIVGLLFILTYITFIILNIEHVKSEIFKKTHFFILNETLTIGFFIIIILEILTIIFLFLFSKILEKISNHSKQYSNKNIVGLMYSMLTFGIKEKVDPKVIDNIALGNHDIDQINPEVFIENIREIPKDIHILLSKAEDVSIIRKLFPKKDVPTIRKLLIIYPNKEVYSCKLSISKNIVKRISEIKSEDTVNKQKE